MRQTCECVEWAWLSMVAISITRAYEAKWKSRKLKLTCDSQFSSPFSFLSTVDSFPMAPKCNQGGVPLIYPMWGCTSVPILLGPETEVKPITSEKITQSRRANSVSSHFLESNLPQDSHILISACSCNFEACHLKTSLRL